ncbi:unnamed protein product [Bemisia tabaci]|uniref:CHK kinase-like domain-containing protein n=1 Tax=Bemisia tabaci TaxID=7038 RepID=A0A9P0A6P0_BEMTA|nr:unnamed protein product [Bemisia tabaci]
MSVIEWLTSKILPEAVKAGSFGIDVRSFISFEVSDQRAIDQMCSDVIFGDVVLETTKNKQLKIKVVIKTRRRSLDTLLETSKMFHNEVLFYTKILPLFKKYDRDNFLSTNICEYVYGRATNDHKLAEDVIILKHLAQKCFKLSEDRLYLDQRHVELALDRIGRYHGISLLCQASDPQAFDEVASEIQYIPFSEDVGKEFGVSAFLRGLEPLKADEKYRDRLAGLIANCEGGLQLMARYTTDHSGPLSVIAHGDLTRNNMMFKYGPDGEPIEVAFFDFGTINYCSPAIDVSTLLSCNVSAEMRRDHWDHFLQTYHGAVTCLMAGHPRTPSFETVVLDLRRNGVYGYHQCALFAPTMFNLIEGTLDLTPPEWEHLDEAQLKKEMLARTANFKDLAAHPKAVQLMAGVARHMLDKEYIF